MKRECKMGMKAKYRHFKNSILHRTYLYGYSGRKPYRFLRRVAARSELHKCWLAGHLGIYTEEGIRYGVCGCQNMLSDSDLIAAAEWKDKHKRIVNDLMSSQPSTTQPLAPTDPHPESWNGSHWLWFNKKVALHESFARSVDQAIKGQTEDIATLWDDKK